MDWRTSNDSNDTGIETRRDLEPRLPGDRLAGAAGATFPTHRHGRIRLDAALSRDLQVARAAGGRFGDHAGRESLVILATHPSYPSSRAYVLKLHRDARPRQGRFIGRLENVTTGEQFVFGNAEELLACLARDGARLKSE